MEAFFRKDSEIQDLVDVFIEKLFTVSLLSGNDADSEFHRGRQAVEKISLFFKEMANLPEEALLDGIRQLVEQRLPDSRVIDNFPNFYELMNEMIRAGLSKQAAIVDAGEQSSISSEEISIMPIRVTNEDATIASPSSTVALRQYLFSQPSKPSQDGQDIPSESAIQSSESVVESYSISSNTNETDAEQEVVAKPAMATVLRRDPFRFSPQKPKQEKEEISSSSPQEKTASSPTRVVRGNQIPDDGHRLAIVLKQIFSSSSIRWNVVIDKTTFYAQIENVLVYLLEPSEVSNIKRIQEVKVKAKKLGWKVYLCQKEDLSFPRRLERGIRSALR